jgi:hypothetical protein
MNKQENKEPILNIDDLNLDMNDLESLGLLDDSEFPELELETDDILMNLSIKKDYSEIKDKEARKKEFIDDLHKFINQFASTPESDDFIEYYSTLE